MYFGSCHWNDFVEMRWLDGTNSDGRRMYDGGS